MSTFTQVLVRFTSVMSNVTVVIYSAPLLLVMMFICFYFLIHHRISELPRPIAVKLCHVISVCADVIMQIQKLGRPPLKNFGRQNMQKNGALTQLPTLIGNISQRLKL